MRERDAPTLLGLQRRSASPPAPPAAPPHRPASGSPELRLPVTSLLSEAALPPQHEFSDNPRTPDSRDGNTHCGLSGSL